MEISLTPEDINKYFLDALANSDLGKSVLSAVADQIKHITRDTYRSAIRDIIDKQISSMVYEHINSQEIKPIIMELISSTLCENDLRKVIGEATRSLINKARERWY